MSKQVESELQPEWALKIFYRNGGFDLFLVTDYRAARNILDRFKYVMLAIDSIPSN